MIRLKGNTGAALMVVNGLAMVALGLGLLYIRETMTDLFYYMFGCAFAVLLVAASLLFIAVLDWICAAGLGPYQISRLRGLPFLGTAAAVSSVVLILIPGSTIKMLCYFIAVYALVLSVGKFRLARYWRGTNRQQAVMYVLASIAFVFSALLVAVAGQDERNALAVLASYSLFIGLQILLSPYYFRQTQQHQFSGPEQTRA
jgi:hypothetical protein